MAYLSELIYHGIVLDEAKCLKDYGIKSGEMVHVFKKVQPIEKPAVEPKTRLTAGSINLLFKTYGLPTRSVSSFSNAMEVCLLSYQYYLHYFCFLLNVCFMVNAV